MSRPKGFKHTEETKRKLSKIHKGRKFTEEHSRKISEAKKGKPTWMKGKKHTEETKKKMSRVHKGVKLSEEHKRKLRENHPDTSGDKNANWNGGKMIGTRGYIMILKPEHPSGRKYVMEHRLIMEKKLGRYLKSEEVVHHKNEITNDNRLENLMLFANNGEHIKYHNMLKKVVIQCR